MVYEKKLINLAENACRSARILANISTNIKNKALQEMALGLEFEAQKIIFENNKDVEAAQKAGLSKALIDRLILNPARIKAMADGLREIITLPDPVGEVMNMKKRPNNLHIGKMRVPLGVIGIIYESRPNVTADAAGLCLKSGNAVILRGGSEAFNSNIIIAKILQDKAKLAGIPDGCIQMIDITDREAVKELLTLDKYIDVIIPRGGESLIRMVVENSTIPVIKHDKGVCHVYVEHDADMDMAVNIAYNAKVQRPGVCNAMETLLVHEGIAKEFLPHIASKYEEAKVEMRGCKKTCSILTDIKEATEDDWYTEYLDLIISIRIVENIDIAIDHIAKYGSKHSDAIVTKSYSLSKKFLQEVDSAAVYINASTRFTDGNQFGLGAEIGISTQKLHSRGPMGLEDLTCTKFIIYGDGQIRE
ncbi:glutamate-5-semialdehyde dehydrogenase [Candidatus Poribacteria bacterium]|nr:glutamate-5-semialdehyde dehydrogenase [Candidatus Poribacteria bacterium]